MSYAIIGFGAIGQALARAFARKNIQVTVASPGDWIDGNREFARECAQGPGCHLGDPFFGDCWTCFVDELERYPLLYWRKAPKKMAGVVSCFCLEMTLTPAGMSPP